MTTINYVNDIHLDFHVKYTTNPKKLKQKVLRFVGELIERSGDAEILIIAGDFGHVNAVSQLFLEYLSPRYKHIFATWGNHDLYLLSNKDNKKYNRNSFERIQDLVLNTAHIENLTWLYDSRVHEYDGLRIAGHPMPSMPQQPEEWLFYNDVMNDSRYIKYPLDDGFERYWQHGHSSYDAIQKPLDIFISHYPLVRTPQFRNDASIGSYYNFINELKSAHYFFGHVHQRDSFEKAGACFHTHAIGYPMEQFDYSFGMIEL